MQASDYIIAKFQATNKPRKINVFQPTEAHDTRQKLVITRPASNVMLAKEFYQDPKCPFNETEIMQALKKLWLEDHKIKTYEVKKKGELITVWEMI